MEENEFSELAKAHTSVCIRLRYSALIYFQEEQIRTDII